MKRMILIPGIATNATASLLVKLAIALASMVILREPFLSPHERNE